MKSLKFVEILGTHLLKIRDGSTTHARKGAPAVSSEVFCCFGDVGGKFKFTKVQVHGDAPCLSQYRLA